MSTSTQVDDARRWVDAFARAWADPVDGDELIERFAPWVRSNYRFRQPLSRGTGIGLEDLRRRLAWPLFAVLTDVRGTVECWAVHSEVVFIELTLTASIGRRRVGLDACDRVKLIDGRAADRRTYIDPLPLIVAVARAPQVWWPLLRTQLPWTTRRTRKWSPA
jgi:hypothetical protein